MRIGFVGVGTISTAVIHAMSARDTGRCTLFLSPRSADTTEKLAAGFLFADGLSAVEQDGRFTR